MDHSTYLFLSFDLSSKNTVSNFKYNAGMTPVSRAFALRVDSLFTNAKDWVNKKGVTSKALFLFEYKFDSIKVKSIEPSLEAEAMSCRGIFNYNRESRLQASPPLYFSPSLKKNIIINSITEVPANFPGGIGMLYKFVGDNLKYPAEAKAASIGGTCTVRFIVNVKGKVENIHVVKNIAGCTECDEEALRILSLMPDWEPAKTNNIAVNSYFTLPVKFKVD